MNKQLILAYDADIYKELFLNLSTVYVSHSFGKVIIYLYNESTVDETVFI